MQSTIDFSQSVNDTPVLNYDTYIVAFSGGKDSISCFLHLLDLGVDKSKIELWHHDIDGHGETFMDWECTPDYCRKFAAAFGVPIYFSWKEGGFEREMLRHNSLTAPTTFEDQSHQRVTIGGKLGKPSTRRKFPQVSADLSVRWCSPYLKIDVCSAAIRHQARFVGKRTLVISGERGEESKARASYAIQEPDRADCRDTTRKKSKRHVDHWRPVRDWKEARIWAIIERYSVVVHPAYYLGWGRLSCKICIFGNANQFASAHKISPRQVTKMSGYEKEFGCTVKRNTTIDELVQKGTAYPQTVNTALVAVATSSEYTLPIFTDNWTLPAGAYGESCGPM